MEEEPLLLQRVIYRYRSVPITSDDSKTEEVEDIFCDILIDGYIRSECNQNVFLFPVSIKNIIASYYNDNTKFAQFIEKKTRFHRMIKQRQREFAQYWDLQLSQKNVIIITFCLIPSFISIIAMIMGLIYTYNSNLNMTVCNNDNFSIIHPTLFTMIAGIVSVSHMILIAFQRLIISLFPHIDTVEMRDEDKMNKILNKINRIYSFLYLIGIIGTWINMLFYMIWSIIGFSMYHNEMGYECKKSNVGGTMISWSIIMFIAVFIYYGWYALLSIKQVYERRFVSLYPFCVISIVLMIAGVSTYSQNNHVCKNGVYLFIEPNLFAMIAGIIAASHILCIFISPFIESFVFVNDKRINNILSILLSIFYLFWSIAGFYIYGNEMSSDCRNNVAVGIMILCWCIMILIGTYCWWLVSLISDDDDEAMLSLKVILFYTFAAVPIGVLIVGIYTYYGNNDVCSDIGFYPDFMLITGITTTFLIFLIFLISLISINTYTHYYIFGVIMSIFYYIWSIIGLYIYDTKMAQQYECKSSSSGKLMLSSCVVLLIMSIACISRISKKMYGDQKYITSIIYSFIMLSIAMISVAGIIYFDDDNVCQDGADIDYVIDLPLFMMIYGVTTTLYLLFTWIVFEKMTNYRMYVRLNMQNIYFSLSMVLLLLNCTWGGIGFYMYNDQISTQCKQSSIGKFMIASCITLFVSSTAWIMVKMCIIWILCIQDRIS